MPCAATSWMRCWRWRRRVPPSCSSRSARRWRRVSAMAAPRRVVLATGNAGKVRELAALLAPLGMQIVPQAALGIASAEETGDTFVANALLKARHAARAAQLPALA